jgi:nucleotide-binding universal stress UspA family protein
MPGSHTFAPRHSSPEPAVGLRALPPPRHAGQAAEVGRRDAPRLRRILVATDGTAASQGALVVAGLLARRDGAAVDVVSVLPRWGPPAPVHEFLGITGELLTSRLARVIPQSESALGGGRTLWTVRLIDSTSIVSSIAEAAEAGGHDLIVTGRRRGWIDRLLRRPTALAVAYRAPVPVLAVPERVTALPTQAVVGTDGTEADLPVAPAAVGILEEPATVHLVHAGTEDPSAVDGKPASRLVTHAKAIGADLIAMRVRPPESLGDRVLGGVSRQVLRSADGSVLLWGPRASAGPQEETQRSDQRRSAGARGDAAHHARVSSTRIAGGG